MEFAKELAAWMMLASVILVVLIALALGFKAIFNKITDYGNFKRIQEEHREELALYKEQVKKLRADAVVKEVTQ